MTARLLLAEKFANDMVLLPRTSGSLEAIQQGNDDRQAKQVQRPTRWPESAPKPCGSNGRNWPSSSQPAIAPAPERPRADPPLPRMAPPNRVCSNRAVPGSVRNCVSTPTAAKPGQIATCRSRSTCRTYADRYLLVTPLVRPIRHAGLYRIRPLLGRARLV